LDAIAKISRYRRIKIMKPEKKFLEGDIITTLLTNILERSK